MARTKAFDETEVLEKARDLFWKQGYTATSIGDLEKHLGISRSSLYQTFGGKRQLYDKTLAAYQETNFSFLRKHLDGADGLRSALIDLFTRAATQKHPDCQSSARGCYVVNATTEMANFCPDALNFLSKNREQFVAIMEEALARAQVRGMLASDADTTNLANYLFVCYNGLQVVVQTRPDRRELVRAVTTSIEMLPWA
ncbi:TetR/AcrR family transcriptional regulator [Neolewinella antarctica]|uniref:TetR/AcrR family transcriptional repressor of nem operon n=1 Tax=Neolewinella antarctica TaxID=442734 RepID=A0ABX0XGQ8_9BACT|nr:TetR/AcrR family transcriptional regulator [Neolewinella antarctica]NJC27963.1 TetR/AcrR family transcriptional repressor of nem operon [Neolewinella antarctica]